MPWVVGVDEAGYGPNLGPLVQAAVGLWLPDEDTAGWKSLKKHIRPARGKDDGRLIIDDSKKVYTRGGLAALERSVHAVFGTPGDRRSFEDCFRPMLFDACWQELQGEPWFAAAEPFPVEVPCEELDGHCARWAEAYTRPSAARVMLVQAGRFNRITDEADSKAMVLARGLISLVSAMKTIGDATEPLLFLCDKQGGRNYYTSLVQSAFPDGWVAIELESADESRYRVEGLARPVTIIFRPRADGASISVALASMLCKYLREVCMRQFNRFWATHVPGLAPTAGYPGDARRFYDAISEARAKLVIADDTIWRRR